MLRELADESENQCVKMDKSKTKVMMENDTPIYVNNIQIENVENYIYLRQRCSTRDKNQDNEIQRITAGWTTFAKQRDIFKGNIGTCLKRHIWHTARKHGHSPPNAKNKLAAAQKQMERSMLNITYRDRKTNIWAREKTQVTDVIEQVKRRKWTWAGHVTRIQITDGHCVSPPGNATKGNDLEEGPARRRRGELDDNWKSTIWQRITQDRQMWKQHAEAFAQPRDTMAVHW